MKKYLLVALMVITLGGCGAADTGNATDADTVKSNMDSEIQNAETEQSTETVQDAESVQGTENMQDTENAGTETDVTEKYYEDNFSVSTEDAASYAKKIQAAVGDKDMDKLADLIAYPVYLGIGQDGEIIESREDFMKLDKAEVFTDDLCDSIKNADKSDLEASMAGFVLWNGEGTPSITFGVQDGKLGIVGINY